MRRIKDKRKKGKGGRGGEGIRSGVFFLDAGYRMQETRDKRQEGDWCRHVGCGLTGLIRPTGFTGCFVGVVGRISAAHPTFCNEADKG